MTRIAIPNPTSFDLAYNRLNWPAYADAIRRRRVAEPIAVPLDLNPRAIAELANSCQAILLPGSPADVNPRNSASHATLPVPPPTYPGKTSTNSFCRTRTICINQSSASASEPRS